MDTDTFENQFQSMSHKKINYGVQQLFVIGLYPFFNLILFSFYIFLYFSGLFDIIPKPKVLTVLQKYLPKKYFKRLHLYVTTDCKKVKSYIDWKNFKSIVDKLDTTRLNQCSKELMDIFENIIPDETCIKIFHIDNNDTCSTTEPTVENSAQMIYNFLTYIYQRNILASLIKYIFLRPLIQKLELIITSYKSIFALMKKRLQEILFECILTSFNGSNYDNYLLCNYLSIIQSRLNQKISIFKKGASISTMILTNKANLSAIHTITDKKHFLKKKKQFNNQWLLKLYFKDIRNLVAANMSLDKVGALFNLNISKLCFPYNKAISIEALKSITSLYPLNEEFWKDSFSNKNISLENRLHAQTIFENEKCSDLYDFNTFYLKQDCILLHNIVLTLFKTYLDNNINLFLRRNFSQSSLSYQQFFILEPSKQILHNIAPRIIEHPFYNYFIKQAVTGGLVTSFVHGTINTDTIINEHLNYIENPNLNEVSWPNFANITNWGKSFKETPEGISTIDIRSLYPSAACKKLPVNSPLFYSRFIPCDFEKIKDLDLRTLNLEGFCMNCQDFGNHTDDIFKLVNKPPRFYNEFYAINHYLSTLPANIQILRFQTQFTALGQLYFDEFPIDGFLSFRNLNDNIINIKFIQYHSVYYHGHKNTCSQQNNSEQILKKEKTEKIKNIILQKWLQIKHIFNLHSISFEYVEIYDCDFLFHKIPKKGNFLLSYAKQYSYHSFLQKIYNNNLTGFLVIKDLEIAKNNQNPIFGFIVQKVDYDIKRLSPYTQDQLKYFYHGKRVIGIHKSKSFMVISTEYFNWLHKTFGFEKTPDIYHALLFQTDYYLKSSIECKLILRKELKSLIKNEQNEQRKQNYEIQAELIKLMLNSCYGFTLCNVTSTKYKIFENRTCLPKRKKRQAKILSAIQINNFTYLVELSKNKQEKPFQTLLGQVGCYILFHSKIILLKRLYFLLKFLNPQKAQLLYMDTDSAHFLVKHKEFENNVDNNLKSLFTSLFPKHFENGNKISGIWVQEGFYNMGEYIGEKCYRLHNENNYLTHMKGLNQNFQLKYINQNIDPKQFPCISYNMFCKSSDFVIFKTYMSKDLFSNFVPNKRYFVSASGSLPLKFS